MEFHHVFFSDALPTFVYKLSRPGVPQCNTIGTYGLLGLNTVGTYGNVAWRANSWPAGQNVEPLYEGGVNAFRTKQGSIRRMTGERPKVQILTPYSMYGSNASRAVLELGDVRTSAQSIGQVQGASSIARRAGSHT